jgi:single-strand DNA-binding protein
MNSFLEHRLAIRITPLLCALERGHTELQDSDGKCEMRLFVWRSEELSGSGLPVDAIARKRRGCIVLMRVSLVQFRLLLGHCFGAFATPGGTRSSASPMAPRRGLGSAQNKFENSGKKHRANFFRVPPRMQTFGAWESRPLAWLRPGVTRADREFKNGDSKMYINHATLMGYLGGDAEVRTGKNDQKFTTFSIATKTSYKDKESGEYISRTEWHHCIVFGKFGEFAATLKKGAHIQVEGEIRHTEYTPKKAKKPVRTDSIRVTSILKLDRAEKAALDEEVEEEIPSEDEAA